MSILQTQRLLLRPIQVDAWPTKSAIDQQPEVYQYQGFILQSDGSKRGRTPEEVRCLLEMRVGEFHGILENPHLVEHQLEGIEDTLAK